MTLTPFSTSQEAQQAAALMVGYRFDLGYHDAPQWVSLWLELYRPTWIRDAVVEALYQGRYKAFSVRQILELWQKRGQPIRHTTYEFEAAVCREYGGAKLVAIAAKPSATYPHSANNKTDTSKADTGEIDINRTDTRKTDTNKTDPAAKQRTRQYAGGRMYQSLSSVSFNLSKSKSELIETAETLHAHRQPGDRVGTSTRAIQPFKPALPFSAQTLRLTKQKASLAVESSY